MVRVFNRLKKNHENLRHNIILYFSRNTTIIKDRDDFQELKIEINTLKMDKYIESELDKRNKIEELLRGVSLKDKSKIMHILHIKNNILDKENKKIDVNRIGTSINIIRDFYHDLHRDIRFFI